VDLDSTILDHPGRQEGMVLADSTERWGGAVPSATGELSRHLLVVEDDPGIAVLERRRLERAGYTVTTVETAEAALAQVMDGRVALIVLDDGLPGGLTGLAFYRQLKAAGYHVPVIMVTGRSDEATVIAALRAGVHDFVTKSSAYLDYLPEAVRRTLAQVATEHRLAESEQRFRATIEQAAVGIAHIALDGRWRLVNQRLCDILGYDRAELLARTHQELLPPPEQAAYDQAARRLLAGEVPTFAMEQRYRRADGTLVWVNLTVSLLRADDGTPRYFIAAAEDISARKRAEAERDQLLRREQAARAQAEATARAREEFLIAASHEFKTPLATIKGNAELLARRLGESGTPADRVARVLARLQGQIGRMESLVASLLDLSRIQQEGLVLSPAPVDLAALARRVLDRAAPPGEEASHDLVLDAPVPLTGWWDADRLDQALTNLVANALQYSPAGTVVQLRLVQCEGAAEITVSDQGVGIPRAELATIFEPFARGSTAPSIAEGTGLGLYLAAKIVERHGGSIGVQSEPGYGSTFTIRLPLRPPGSASPARQVIQEAPVAPQ
jgi:PAS domain S-box-containing protein